MERERPDEGSARRQALLVPLGQLVQEAGRRAGHGRVRLLQRPAGQLGADGDVVLAVSPDVAHEEIEDVGKEIRLHRRKRTRKSSSVAMEPPAQDGQSFSRQAGLRDLLDALGRKERKARVEEALHLGRGPGRRIVENEDPERRAANLGRRVPGQRLEPPSQRDRRHRVRAGKPLFEIGDGAQRFLPASEEGLADGLVKSRELRGRDPPGNDDTGRRAPVRRDPHPGRESAERKIPPFLHRTKGRQRSVAEPEERLVGEKTEVEEVALERVLQIADPNRLLVLGYTESQRETSPPILESVSSEDEVSLQDPEIPMKPPRHADLQVPALEEHGGPAIERREEVAEALLDGLALVAPFRCQLAALQGKIASEDGEADDALVRRQIQVRLGHDPGEVGLPFLVGRELPRGEGPPGRARSAAHCRRARRRRGTSAGCREPLRRAAPRASGPRSGPGCSCRCP